MIEIKTSALSLLGNRVAVRRLDNDKQTAAGLLLPDSADKPMVGEVVAVGEGENKDGKMIPICLKVGDNVIFPKFGGTSVKTAEGEVLILNFTDILAQVK